MFILDIFAIQVTSEEALDSLDLLTETVTK
jgi:hypothetical protein